MLRQADARYPDAQLSNWALAIQPPTRLVQSTHRVIELSTRLSSVQPSSPECRNIPHLGCAMLGLFQSEGKLN